MKTPLNNPSSVAFCNAQKNRSCHPLLSASGRRSQPVNNGDEKEDIQPVNESDVTVTLPPRVS